MLATCVSVNSRILQIRLCRRQRASGRVYPALRSSDRSGLLVGLYLGLKTLLFGSCAGLRQPRVGVAVEFRQPQRRLLLREIRLRRRQVRLRLPNTAIGIGSRLACLHIVLAQLLIEDRDLIASGLRFRLRLGEARPCA